MATGNVKARIKQRGSKNYNGCQDLQLNRWDRLPNFFGRGHRSFQKAGHFRQSLEKGQIELLEKIQII